eukprot:CAMPEP_0198138958 /NCGR_PEP_ID=MMETSP1443-20131203/2309_1 /TAXON_ID=186043 /ORGANISM="Entomoneis sp., Strain CCMP2396" /LENGTH=300 /DNA_ID=CAMNT_0043800915 /DNA_START=137 /DNA_END=1039 /DNA_ORIENTATION=-
MVKLSAAKLNQNYTSDSDSDDDDLSSLGSDEGDLMKDYKAKEKNVLVSHNKEEEDSSGDGSGGGDAAADADADADGAGETDYDNLISLATREMKAQMEKAAQKGDFNASATSWNFDLGAMQDQADAAEKQVKQRNQAVSASIISYEDIASRQSSLDEELTCISQEMEKADKEVKKVRHKTRESKKKSDAAIMVKQQKRQEVDQQLEKKREQREARMEKVRARIAKEKEEKELANAGGAGGSEESRRTDVYQWYLRCGMVTRAELKKRLEKEKIKGIQAEDVDLLPWNFNGTLVNTSKMMK